MKAWKKNLVILLVIAVVFVSIRFSFREQKNCCLCSSFRYHAPCLIDLNTGSLVEPALYVPHETKIVELAEVQPETSTFSFIKLGGASGIKLTGSHRIEMDIPDDSLQDPSLCRECRKQLPSGYTGRYIFADLYDEKILIPMEADRGIFLRCYQITIVRSPETNGVAATIQGTL